MEITQNTVINMALITAKIHQKIIMVAIIIGVEEGGDIEEMVTNTMM